ncbi:MAG: DUF3015 family protein [Candidatus Margulisiibacteriota bacterium]
MKKILLIMLLTISIQSFAKTNAWRDCGIGAIVFPDNGSLAAISNLIWDLGTTAVTSQISSEETCSGAKASTAKFIMETYPILEEETIRGNGEHVDSMLTMLNCNINSKSKLTESIRSSLADEMAKVAYVDLTRSEKAEAFYNIVDTKVSNDFAKVCTI